jgi:hypothetical protein
MPDQDQFIDAVMAHSIQADAARKHPLSAWVVTRAIWPGSPFVARLVTNEPTPYVLVADTLADLHAHLPSGMAWGAQVSNSVVM